MSVERRGMVAWLALLASLIASGIFIYRFATMHGSTRGTHSEREIVAILLSLCLCVVLAAIVGFKAYRGDLWRINAAAQTFTLTTLLALGVIWYLVGSAERPQIGIGTPVKSAAETNVLLGKALAGRKPLRVPTGVFLQAVEFTNASDVSVSGYIWQRYAKGTPKKLERGVILPEALDSYGANQVYTHTDEKTGEETVGYYFNATFRQNFDYANYPFDRQDVWVRMWHKDFNEGAILVPDFDAYGDMTPSALPGLEKMFVSDAWQNEYTTFSYNSVGYNTNFGFGKFTPRPPFPEMYFSVGIKRQFLSVFVARVIPLGIVSILLFAVLVATTKDENRMGATGFNTFALLSYTAALFFVVVLDHIQLRNSLASPVPLYMEYFYFILYTMILLVSLNGVSLTATRDLKVVERHDNALPKIFYWPILLGLLLIVTVWRFYGQ